MFNAQFTLRSMLKSKKVYQQHKETTNTYKKIKKIGAISFSL